MVGHLAGVIVEHVTNIFTFARSTRGRLLCIVPFSIVAQTKQPMMSLNICSMNCRGLNNRTKRKQVFNWINDQNFSICFLQESHLKSSLKKDWLLDWDGKAIFSGTKTNSEGVCILFHKNLIIDIIQYTELISGRLQTVDIRYEDRLITLINIYGPNNDDELFFITLQNYLLNNEDKTFIIGGDFNTVLDIKIDKKNGRNDTHKKCRKIIKSIINTNKYK